MTRPGGNLSPDARARRLAILRELWLEGRPVVLIAERLRVSPGTVSGLAAQAGLPRRQVRRGVVDNHKFSPHGAELSTL